MDLTSLFVWAIITAIIGIMAKALIGFNLKEFLAEIAVISFAGPVVLFLIASPHDVDATTSFLNWYVNMFANALPGIVVGEIVGTIIAVMTKISKQF